jgi:hypothetical protein
MWSISIAIMDRSPDKEVPDTVIAPRALPNMRGALRSEAKHPVSRHRITIGWHLETRLM